MPARFWVRLIWRTRGGGPSPISARNAARCAAAPPRAATTPLACATTAAASPSRTKSASPRACASPSAAIERQPFGVHAAAVPACAVDGGDAADHDGNLHRTGIGTAPAVEIDFGAAAHPVMPPGHRAKRPSRWNHILPVAQRWARCSCDPKTSRAPKARRSARSADRAPRRGDRALATHARCKRCDPASTGHWQMLRTCARTVSAHHIFVLDKHSVAHTGPSQILSLWLRR